MTLLEQAKKLSKRKQIKEISAEEIEVAMAWLKDEISLRATRQVLNMDGSTQAYRVNMLLREAFRRGLLIEAKS